MRTPKLVRYLIAASCLPVAVFGAGCSPGGSSSKSSSTQATAAKAPVTDPAKLGNVTITVWDKNTVAGPNETQQTLNRDFHAKYPNITIHRVARAFEDLKTTLKLALSSNNPPDVVQVNQGYGDLGAFAKAGLLRPVDDYAKAYGWVERYPPTLLAQNRSTPDGGWGRGNLYGISTYAELVGLYYNKQLLAQAGLKPPRTWTEFTADLPKLKAKGILPIQFGDSNKSPAIHIFGFPLAEIAGAKAVNDLVFGRDGASWKDPKALHALQTVADWGKKGYIPSSANGQDDARASANFAKGEGAFFISGSWFGGDLGKMGSNGGFTALAPSAGAPPVAMGGLGLLWAVTSKSKNDAAAAAYVNYITSPEAAKVIASGGDLPANTSGDSAPPPTPVAAGLSSSIQAVLKADSLVPYLDYSTSDFYDVLSGEIQKLIVGRSTPEQSAAVLEQDLTKFKASQ
jgi:raffinose/stachyose/melibiose transport system substrate-binding protein